MSMRPSQFELFPQSGASGKGPARPDFPRREIRLVTENLVILGVFVVMLMVLSFSLGVERGRTIVLEARQASPRDDSSEPQQIPPLVVEKTVQEQATPGGDVTEVAMVHEVGGGPGSVEGPASPDADTVSSEAEKASDPDPAAEAKKTVDKVYTIQVASFRKLRAAQEEAESLKKKGFEAEVISKGKWSIVCVGQFEEKGEAKSFAQKLKHRYKDSLIRSL